MARPTYSDLIILKAPTAGLEGYSQTALNNIIILLMKDAFLHFAKGEYDTYAVSVNHPTLDTTDVYSVIIRRASKIAGEWIRGMNNDTYELPEVKLTDEDINALTNIIENSIITREYINRTDQEVMY
jgi:hypothetical protein